ncbi:hypothetical protein [Arenibacter lacus]|uniref:hypothetical protein n=1 Tax=Arenibacter lacus TaxID=2608629 RepID=UPI00123CBF29|nr:hypothetical protein [Arenibacter lacus]
MSNNIETHIRWANDYFRALPELYRLCNTDGKEREALNLIQKMLGLDSLVDWSRLYSDATVLNKLIFDIHLESSSSFCLKLTEGVCYIRLKEYILALESFNTAIEKHYYFSYGNFKNQRVLTRIILNKAKLLYNMGYLNDAIRVHQSTYGYSEESLPPFRSKVYQ